MSLLAELRNALLMDSDNFPRDQLRWVSDPYANDPGKPTEEMNARCEELVTTDEPMINVKLLDAIVMKDGKGDRSLVTPAIANESD